MTASTSPPRRVLVVDDDTVHRASLIHFLERDFEVCAVMDGEQAVERLAGSEETYDVILLDLHIPRTHAIEVFKTLRDLFPQLAGRVVFMSAATTPDETEFLARASHRSVGKPFAFDALRATIEQVAPRLGDSAREGGSNG